MTKGKRNGLDVVLMRTKKQFVIYTSVLVAVQTVLAHFVQAGMGQIPSGVFGVLSIAAALLYVLLSFSPGILGVLMVSAFAATLCADIFLAGLFTFEGQKLIAMCFFCIVQGTYAVRIYRNHTCRGGKITHLGVRAGFAAVALLATWLVLGEKTDALSLISIFYFANLVVNLVFACIQIRESRLFPVGLLLFVLCDIVVGLSEMALSYISMREDSIWYAVTHSGVNLAWIFYVPSQTVLAISGNERRFLRHRRG